MSSLLCLVSIYGCLRDIETNSIWIQIGKNQQPIQSLLGSKYEEAILIY